MLGIYVSLAIIAKSHLPMEPTDRNESTINVLRNPSFKNVRSYGSYGLAIESPWQLDGGQSARQDYGKTGAW